MPSPGLDRTFVAVCVTVTGVVVWGRQVPLSWAPVGSTVAAKVVSEAPREACRPQRVGTDRKCIVTGSTYNLMAPEPRLELSA